MKKYENHELVQMLSDLNIEQIDKIENEFSQRYPKQRTFSFLCTEARGKIRNREMRAEFVALIEQYKNTPPDVAASNGAE